MGPQVPNGPGPGAVRREPRPGLSSLVRTCRYKNIPFSLYSTHALRRPGREGGMRRLGVVENIAHDATVLIRSEFAPSRRAEVRDNWTRRLARVAKVF